MSEETEELPVAYRQMRRHEDGRMRVVYVDENGETISYDDLDDYRVNEVIGSTSVPEETADSSDPASPAAPARVDRRDDEDRDEGENMYERAMSGPIGPWDNYEFPTEGEGIMWDIQEKLGNWLGGSRLVKGMEKVGAVTEKATDKALDFMRAQEERRQRLTEQGIMTQEEVAATPDQAATPAPQNPQGIPSSGTLQQPNGNMPTAPGVQGNQPSLSMPTESINMPGGITVDTPLLKNGMGNYGSLGTMDQRLPSVNDPNSLIGTMLGGRSSASGGLSPEVKEQIAIGQQSGLSVKDVEQQRIVESMEEQGFSQWSGLENLGEGVKEVGAYVNNPGGGQVPPDVEDYIREAAKARNIDPDIAVRVAKSEGLAEGVWQSYASRGGIREPSYGPFQLLEGGPGTGYPAGMGNDFQRATGLRASDKKNVYAGIDFALDGAAKNGWGAWYGAAKAGVSKWDGLENATPIGVKTDPYGLTARPDQKPTPGFEYDPYSPKNTTSDYSGGLQGGRLSADEELGGYGGSGVFNDSPISNQDWGFTSPTAPSGVTSRSVTTTRESGGDQDWGSFGPSTNSFSRYSENSDNDDRSGTSNTPSRETVVNAYEQYADSRTGSDGGSTNPGYEGGGGNNTSDQSSDSGGWSTGNDDWDSWNDDNSWF